MEQVLELLREARDHWDDGYWWIDHQWLASILVLMFAAGLELTVHYTKLRLTQSIQVGD